MRRRRPPCEYKITYTYKLHSDCANWGLQPVRLARIHVCTRHYTHITIGVHYAWLTGCVRAGEAAAAASQCFEFAPGANAADGYIGINTGIPSSAGCRARSELSCTHTLGAKAMGAGLRHARGRWVWRRVWTHRALTVLQETFRLCLWQEGEGERACTVLPPLASM